MKTIYIYMCVCVCVCPRVSQRFCNILVDWDTIWRLFYRDREGDEPHWTVRCQTHLILSMCYTLDLLLWLGARPRSLRVLGLRDLTWSLMLLQSEHKFLNHLFTVLGSSVYSIRINCAFTFLAINVFATLWPSSKSWGTNFRFRLHCTFICAAFKSLIEWRDV